MLRHELHATPLTSTLVGVCHHLYLLRVIIEHIRSQNCREISVKSGDFGRDTYDTEMVPQPRQWGPWRQFPGARRRAVVACGVVLAQIAREA
eukprot:COSAG01_NODE_2970_length_6775_cov_8.832235_8_plen_92_part_00